VDNEFKLSGIVIGAVDYKEKDKLITIFSLELGKITAKLVGVKNKNAKLKWASQIFCFAEFMLVRRGEFYTVIGASQIESFYDLTADYSKFLIGQALVEMLNVATQPVTISEKLFIETAKALNVLTYSDSVCNLVVLTKYILILLQFGGYGIDFDNCNHCKNKLFNVICFDKNLGELTCGPCANNYSQEISKKTYNFLKLINSTEVASMASIKIKDEDLFEIVPLLCYNFEDKFGKKIKTFKNILNQ